MITGKRISPFSICILLTGVGIIYSSVITYSQTTYPADSINLKSQFVSPAPQNKIPLNEPDGNFFKTDSIFSFHSAKGYVPSLLFNLRADVKAPLHYKTRQWLIAGAAVGITTTLIFVDEDIDEWARTLKEKHNWINKTSPVITQFGGNAGVITLITAGLISAALKNEKGVQTCLLASQAVINSGIKGYIIKNITGRERPKGAYIYSQQDGGKWNGPFGK